MNFLVDTSVWIEFFRNHAPSAAVLSELLIEDGVAVAGPIVTEILRGIANDQTRSEVQRLLAGCSNLEMPVRLWEQSGEIGALVTKKGFAVKSFDLLIACYALIHQIPILTLDKDFRSIARAGAAIEVISPSEL